VVNHARGITGSTVIRDATWVYVLQVSHPNDLDRVCVFLRSVHLRVETNEDGSITATAPGAPTPEHERREVSGYVTTWNALNPANPVTLVEVP
jgi:hypothetical protein